MEKPEFLTKMFKKIADGKSDEVVENINKLFSKINDLHCVGQIISAWQVIVTFEKLYEFDDEQKKILDIVKDAIKTRAVREYNKVRLDDRRQLMVVIEGKELKPENLTTPLYLFRPF